LSGFYAAVIRRGVVRPGNAVRTEMRDAAS
jgi:hypothetical protein